ALLEDVSGDRRASAVALVLGAACSVQVGAAVAKSLFPELGPTGVVFLRLVFGSAALWAISRPEIRGRERADLRLVAALGVVLVSMNVSFYEALSRAPLGIAVTVEFLGPLAVAVLGSRRLLDLVWVVLAGAGVALLADARGGRGPLLGALHPARSPRRPALGGAVGPGARDGAGRGADRPVGHLQRGRRPPERAARRCGRGSRAPLVGASVVARDRVDAAAAAARLRRDDVARARRRGARRAPLPARAPARAGVDRDRAGGRGERRSRGAPALAAGDYAAGLMFWLTLNTFCGSYCALTRASRS